MCIMKRRKFLSYSIILLGSTLFARELEKYALHVRIFQEPYQTIATLIDDLFPPNLSMPSAHTFNAIGFLQAVMQDVRVPSRNKQTILDGVKLINQTTQNDYLKNYIELPLEQRETTLQAISQKEWGDNFLWYLMNYTLEAMLSDPVYGGNTDEIGWRWLAHTSGLPQPPKVNPYV